MSGDARDLYVGEPVEEDISDGPWSSVGAGVIVAASGVAITSARVVRDSAGVEAVMTDGSRHAVTVVGLDARTDVAVVRLAGMGPFPFARFGDSARLEVGDWVIAVGSPYGLQATAKRIATELLERGRVRWSWLGVSGQPLTPELARALGVTPMRGLLVTDVVRSGPGKEGDRIVLLVQRADVALYVAFVAPTERSGRRAHE